MSQYKAAVTRLFITACVIATLGLGLLPNPTPSWAGQSFSGLEVPRFVTLKSNRVNVRTGPSKDHPVQWQYTYRGLPVEIIAETQDWRQIRDSDGDTGWVHQSLLDGRRSIIILGDGTGRPIAMRADPNLEAEIKARAEPGVVGRLLACNGAWCATSAGNGNFVGWIHRSLIWGTYPGETIR